jgi:23S rRNA (uracil1939-C5)-methyltransferase
MEHRKLPKNWMVNSRQTRLLYQRILELASIFPNDTVYDLYCGVGSISIFLARQAKQVIGIEYVESSVAAARNNAEHNGISNVSFLAGDMKDLLVNELFATRGAPDVVITDAPQGLSDPGNLRGATDSIRQLQSA